VGQVETALLGNPLQDRYLLIPQRNDLVLPPFPQRMNRQMKMYTHLLLILRVDPYNLFGSRPLSLPIHGNSLLDGLQIHANWTGLYFDLPLPRVAARFVPVFILIPF
jgi:hypothetical protein